MAIGDIGRWRDSAGSQIFGTGYGSFNFATQEQNDNSIYAKPDSATIEFDEAGLYLLRWVIQMDDSSNNRTCAKSRATQTVGSGDFFSTHHTGYSRNSANRVLTVLGRAFINASVNDRVTIQGLRDTDAPTGGSLVDHSFLEVVKLGGDGDFDYAIYEQSTGNQGYGGTTPNDVAFGAAPIETSTTSIELQANDTDIRLKRDDARYWIFYGITGDAGGSRTQRVSRALSGSTLIPGSGSYVYQRNSANEHAGMLGEFMHEVGTTDEDVSIQVWRGDGVAADQGGADVDGSWNTIASEVTCLVIDMPDHWNSAAFYDQTGAQTVGGGSSTDLNIFRTELWADSGFTRDSNTDVTIGSALDIWATGSTVTARNNISSGSRLTAGITFEIEGTDQVRGEHKQYTRGNQGTQDTFGGSWLWGGIYSVAANDTFQANTIDRGGNGASDNTRQNYTAAFFLDLDNLEATGSTDALTADDIASSSEVTSPNIGQEHSLNSTSVESSSEITSPNIGQSHALLAGDAQSASEVSSPSLSETHALNTKDVESLSEVSIPSLGQTHNLLSNNIESSSEASSPSLSQEHNLSADDVESTSEVTTPALAAVSGTDNLDADDAESVSELSSPALGQIHSLLAGDIESNSEVSAPYIGQTHTLNADDVENQSETSTPTLAQVHELFADDAESQSEASTPNLTSISIIDALEALDVESVSEVVAPALAQVHVLYVGDLTSLTEVSQPSLSYPPVIQTGDNVFDNTVSNYKQANIMGGGVRQSSASSTNKSRTVSHRSKLIRGSS